MAQLSCNDGHARFSTTVRITPAEYVRDLSTRMATGQTSLDVGLAEVRRLVKVGRVSRADSAVMVAVAAAMCARLLGVLATKQDTSVDAVLEELRGLEEEEFGHGW